MPITLDLMAAFVHCRYKAFLKLTGEVGMVTDYELLQRRLADDYQQKTRARLAEGFPSAQILDGPSSILEATHRHQLILDAPSVDGQRSVVFPAIQRLPDGPKSPKEWAVVAFSPKARLSTEDKRLAALIGTALSTWHALHVKHAQVVHGPERTSTKLVLLGNNGQTRLAKESAGLLHDLEVLATDHAPPPMYLNDHCGICEYRDRCRKDAEQRDDLSLLRGLQPREIDAWKKRGIFTVTQLSYTFRANTMGKSSQQPKRHPQPLQAMAIRDKKTYVRKRPEMPTDRTKVYFDVESIPERGFFYLIGAVVVTDGTPDQRHQFWADGQSHEERIWRDFLALLNGLPEYRAVHFGRYERDFVREMQRRYPAAVPEATEKLLPRLFDVHASIRTNVFLPVYGNGLKQIANFLGTGWRGPVESGIDSIVWRYRWEETRADSFKTDLLAYNYDDCLAVVAVFNYLTALANPPRDGSQDFEETENLVDARAWNFSRKTFASPAFEAITKCAYFNYQQDKVFFRQDKAVRRSVQRRRRAAKSRLKPNTIVDCGPPQNCLTCTAPNLRTYGSSFVTKTVKNIRFVRGGIKRWVVRYQTRRYGCSRCKRQCYSPEYPTGERLFGRELAAWAVYQHVAHSQPFKSITQSVNDVFGYSFGDSWAKKAQTELARFYEGTEAKLVGRLRERPFVCVDEARVGLRRGKGYVWVFSTPLLVVYRFSDTRDATVLNAILEGFSGVVVSDFYGVYDSVACTQQKCLIHLIRDVNDDLLKQPFDEELKAIASRFTALMTPVIESIDRFGLSKRHLGKFVRKADAFRDWAERQQFGSTIAQHYQNRIAKYGSRLFTFLHHDGVPWNNNLAENAVKLFASRRRFLDGLMSRDGIKEYLIFLSIYETMWRNGGSFLRFMLSEKTDLFDFLGE